MKVSIPLMFCASLGAAAAQDYQCHGDTPDWRLAFDQSEARFLFPAPTEMDVMLVTRPEGLEWPQAYTLIGERDTAIVLLESETCGEQAFRAHVMTQRAQTPILLTGCCSASQ